MRLSIKAQFLIVPLLGLLMLISVSAVYYVQFEKQNKLIDEIAHEDLLMLERYTHVFESFTNKHLQLYNMLYLSENYLDEGQVYDIGRSVLDSIYKTREELVAISKTDFENSEHNSLVLEDLKETLDAIDSYRTIANTAVEMTTVSLPLAYGHLYKANRHFMEMHIRLFERLNEIREHIHLKAVNQIDAARNAALMNAVINLVLGLTVLGLGYLFSYRLSSSLKQQIERLSSLSDEELGLSSEHHKSETELERMSSAIELFKNSLIKLHDHEKALRKANEELESRVLERTSELEETNGQLKVEVKTRKEAEERLYLYKQVIQHTSEAVIITDSNNRILDVNPAYEKQMGHSREDLIGQKPNIVQSGKHEDSFYKEMYLSLEHRGHWSGEIWDLHKSGQVIPFWLTISRVEDPFSNAQYIGLFRNIAELKKAEQKLESLAFFDSLTKLPNRTRFNQRLNDLLEHSDELTSLAILFIDLDRFKQVNDSMGHTMGDYLLQKVAQRIQSVEDIEVDLVSRLGGDEFTVIIKDYVSIERIERYAKQLLQVLEAPFVLGDSVANIGASIGIATYPEDGQDAELLKKHADMAMYQAKEGGRNQYQVYSSSQQNEQLKRTGFIKEILSAVKDNKLVQFYQPLLDVKSGKLVGAEALVRWPDGDGWIPPSHFIPLAEEVGVINDIDQWALLSACQQAQLWRKRYSEDFTISVNLSANLIQDQGTPIFLQGVLEQTGLPAENLMIEVTETGVFLNPKRAQMNLKKVAEMGVRIALDDFGTGFSSLTHLTQFPLNKIKIDYSFTSKVLQDESMEAVVRSMIDLANSLGVEVVAEGIETFEQEQFYKDLNCQYGQGFYYSCALATEQFETWSHERGCW